MKLICGDCLEVLKTLEENSIDSIVTDPPYELGFMGKSWDNTGIANNPKMWAECLRVLKPGGHLLSFGGTRTYHRMAVAIEDAGFEVRDMVEWVYGSGFPKSLNIGKAVDKLQGNERKELSERGGAIQKGSENWQGDDRSGGKGSGFKEKFIETKGTSEWEGWGTALKPSHEPICLARKPLAEKTVAENVLKYGTGGINIDESRVEYQSKEDMENNGFRKTNIQNLGKTQTENNTDEQRWSTGLKQMIVQKESGRFPANLITDGSEEVRECFPETKSGKSGVRTSDGFNDGIYGKGVGIKAGQANGEFGDSGNASRFFKSIIYQAKASKSERNKGCDGLDDKFRAGLAGADRDTDEPLDDVSERFRTQPAKNNHPTVKPIALMEYLIKMVTPKGGIVLDPFMGSGSTGVACKNNGFSFIGIEKESEYLKIAEERIKNTLIKLL